MTRNDQKARASDHDARTLIQKAAPDEELRRLADDDRIRNAVADALLDIEELEHGKPEGAMSTVMGGISLSISEASWIFLEAAVGAALVVVGPEPLSKTVGGGLLLDAVFKVKALIQTLDATDQAVCAAIADQRRKKKQRRDPDVRVTKKEIVAYFNDLDEEAPVELSKILDELVSENVITRERENGTAFYSIEF